ALYRSVVVPLLLATAEACGGFDWDDAAFDRAYADLEASLFRPGHAYAAVAPLVGLSVGGTVDLGGGLRVRASATGEVASPWPDARLVAALALPDGAVPVGAASRVAVGAARRGRRSRHCRAPRGDAPRRVGTRALRAPGHAAFARSGRDGWRGGGRRGAPGA